MFYTGALLLFFLQLQSWDCSSLCYVGFLLQWLLLLWITGSHVPGRVALVDLRHVGSAQTRDGALCWQMDSYPLSCQGVLGARLLIVGGTPEPKVKKEAETSTAVF